ncbi:MAG TPA: class I SAM-dependent methyltransferase [Pirellulales bacterium]
MTAEPIPSSAVNLTDVQRTSLLTFYARALDARSPRSILHDRFADQASRRLDFDFSSLRVASDQVVALALRAKALDAWTREFLSAHATPNQLTTNPASLPQREPPQVVHLGCGLDARWLRVNPPPDVDWFDVDFPNVLALRARLYSQRSPNYSSVAADVLSPDWLAEIPSDRPTLIVAEGILPYLAPAEAQALLARLVSHFREGELIFDAYNRFGVWFINRHASMQAAGAQLRWSLGDPHALATSIPGLRLVEELTRYDPADVRGFSWGSRMVYRLWNLSPAIKRMGRLLRYRF